MKQYTSHRQAWIRIAIFCLIHFAGPARSEEKAPYPEVRYENGTLSIIAENVPLGTLMAEILIQAEIDIMGLDERSDETVFFSASPEPPLEVIKRLLRYLGEKNHAFEYRDDRLIRVSVFPGSKFKPKTARETRPKRQPASPKKFVGVVRITKIMPDSQAEKIFLEPDDLIIKYGGVQVKNTAALIKEVNAKSEMAEIEMIVVRDEQILRFLLNGGLIGVRIRTDRVSLDTYRKFGLEE